MTDLIEWVNQFISFPPEFQFVQYLLVATILLILLIVTLDFFASIFFAIFKRR